MDALDVSGKIIDDLIEREGGFRDDPDDKGGPTKYGITQTTLSEWRRIPVAKKDVENLTKAEAYYIYQEKFLKQNNIDLIPEEKTRAHLLDAAALHGPRNAITWLQEAVGAEVDGYMGPETLHTLGYYIDHGGSWKEINNHLVKRRLELVRQRVKNIPSQRKYLRQWESRISKFKQ